MGMIFPFEKNSYVPALDRFYMGGTGLGQISVIPLRGYDDNSVGPYSGATGGQSMIKNTVELRYALTLNPMPVYTILFTEAGNVWLTHEIQNPLDLRRSVGFGLRVLVQSIGMVGFDYAYGFDPTTKGSAPPGWHFHFQFGKSL